MDLRALRYFVATVETGSISAAAVKCHVAQPSITLAIAKLENELECKLFDRHRKGSSATPEGERMYKMASDLLQHAQNIKHEFTQKEKTQKISLAVDKNIRIATLESFLNCVNGAQNNLDFELISDTNENGFSPDIRLSTKTKTKNSETFYSIAKESYALLLPKNNLLAYQQDLKPTDLNHQNIISRIHCENQNLFTELVNSIGLELNVVAKVESEEWAHALVRAGLGLTFAPIPDNFSDPLIVAKPILECFGFEAPYREVGLIIDKRKVAKYKSILDGIIHFE